MGLGGVPMRLLSLPAGVTEHTHSKTVQRGTNQAIPPLSPARTGPGGPLRPRTNRMHDVDQGAQGLEVIWSVYAGRREALHRSAGLSEALHARVQSLHGP